MSTQAGKEAVRETSAAYAVDRESEETPGRMTFEEFQSPPRKVSPGAAGQHDISFWWAGFLRYFPAITKSRGR
jgi:hypothetical protein